MRKSKNSTPLNDLFTPLLYSPPLSNAWLDERENNFPTIRSNALAGTVLFSFL